MSGEESMASQSKPVLTPKSAIGDIIAKLEGATGPDRELDALIQCELREDADIYWWDHILMARARSGERDEWRVGTIDPGKVARNFSVAWSAKPIPFYTSSLDASLALVEEKLPGCAWGVSRLRDADGAKATVWQQDVYLPLARVQAATPALAVLLALFKALAHG